MHCYIVIHISVCVVTLLRCVYVVVDAVVSWLPLPSVCQCVVISVVYVGVVVVGITVVVVVVGLVAIRNVATLCTPCWRWCC